jgi:hypothetical protein
MRLPPLLIETRTQAILTLVVVTLRPRRRRQIGCSEGDREADRGSICKAGNHNAGGVGNSMVGVSNPFLCYRRAGPATVHRPSCGAGRE